MKKSGSSETYEDCSGKRSRIKSLLTETNQQQLGVAGARSTSDDGLLQVSPNESRRKQQQNYLHCPVGDDKMIEQEAIQALLEESKNSLPNGKQQSNFTKSNHINIIRNEVHGNPQQQKQDSSTKRFRQHHSNDNEWNNKKKKLEEDLSYYQNPNHKQKTTTTTIDNYVPSSTAATAKPAIKPDFGLSGLLATSAPNGQSTTTSRVYRGVVLKFQEPPDARAPAKTLWRFHVFKNSEQIAVLHISKQSAYLIGRNGDICDIHTEHTSCSSQHAVLQFRAVPVTATDNALPYNDKNTPKLHVQPYLMDLESTNGTFINTVRIDPARYYQLKVGDVLTFGASTREYVLLSTTT